MERHLHSWVGQLDIVKMTVLLKVIYKVDEISIKIPMAFFIGMERPVFRFIWNCKGLQIMKTILIKKEKVEGFTS